MIDTTNKVIQELVSFHNIKTSFATKAGSPSRIARLIDCPISYKGRIRASVMPQAIADILEVGTAKIKDRLLGLNLAYSKDFESHLNFSPVTLYKGWVEDYIDLFKLIDSTLTTEVKAQLKAEVIFLTHHKSLSDLNMQWNPEAEKLLWRPEAQEYKTNERGSSDIVRYKALSIKKLAIDKFKSIIKQELPYCKIRYIF
jgi:spore photoproduct lyase